MQFKDDAAGASGGRSLALLDGGRRLARWKLKAGLVVAAAWLGIAAGLPTAQAEPPTFTTHFFDWYVVSPSSPLDAIQKRWTYQIDWQQLDIAPAEIGNTVHYYETQCRRIQQAGFDGIHYEWHGNPLKPVFREALEKTGLKIAMFYDMEIRFHGQGAFITPTEACARRFVQDIASFYADVPPPLRLTDRNGKIPIVVYGYQFDRQVTDPAAWHQFYRTLIDGATAALEAPVVFHWTNNGSAQQLFGFQHFPEIQSYVFNEAQSQSPLNAHSVTFVVHYDDLGVSFARGGPRPSRWIRNDIRYLEEALWLARHTDPDLVFNYGWNELYEGEHLLPDTTWGSWRCDLAAAMVQDIKQHVRADLPRALIIVDDFLTELHTANPPRAVILQREQQLLARLRGLTPRADVVLPGTARNLADYELVCALNTVKDPAEETALAACSAHVVYVNPQPGMVTDITRRFSDVPSRPIPRADRGPENEYVAIVRPVTIDLGRFPSLQFRCRNSADTVFHIRYTGQTSDGREVQAWLEDSPTDDRQTQDQWLEDRVNIADIARRAAGAPVQRLTRLEIILDDKEANGTFTLDLDYLRFTDQEGTIGWEDAFDKLNDWSVHASFEYLPNARQRFGLTRVTEAGTTFGRVTLQAEISPLRGGPLDEATQWVEPRDSVQVLVDAPCEELTVPIVMVHDRTCWLNTLTPTDKCWQRLWETWWGQSLGQGVSFQSYSWSVTRAGLQPRRDTAAMQIARQPLPLPRIRLAAPPQWDRPLAQTLPLGFEHMQLQRIHGRREVIPYPDPGSEPPTITLEPGEIVELVGRSPE